MQLAVTEVRPVQHFSFYHLSTDRQDKYNKLHFMTRHLISLILSLQSTYLKKTMKITQTISFSRLVDIVMPDDDELDELKKSFAGCYSRLSYFPFFRSLETDYYQFFDGIIKTSETKRLVRYYRTAYIDSKNLGGPSVSAFHMVLKINVQFYPQRFIAEPPCIEQSTRLMRYFGGRNFIRVEFRDALHESTLYSFLRRGFLFGGRYWVYFGQTSGYLEGGEQKSCWFCACPEELESISAMCKMRKYFVAYEGYHQSHELLEMRILKQLKVNSYFYRYCCIDWLGDFSGIKLVCKVSTRQGLCMGKSFPTLNVESDGIRLVVQKDYEGKQGVYTDGCGEISRDLLQRIYEQCGGTFTAFYFRFRGCKGMLQVNPLLRPGTLLLRSSQIKFTIPSPTANYNVIEVVNVAKASYGYLNEQIIVLLDALGAPAKYFQTILDESLASHKDVIYSNDKLKMLLERQRFTLQGNICLRMLLAGVSDSDIVLAQYIGLFQEVELSRMQQKFRIKLPMSRFLYGVYDVFHVLGENEVFIDPSETDGVLISEVVIAKNPCTHPGNIRKARVADPVKRFVEYRQIVNEELLDTLRDIYKGVVVFPVAETDAVSYDDDTYLFDIGNSDNKPFRPVSDQCGGSDLDGDVYFVTWDPKIVDNVVAVAPQTICFNEDELKEALTIQEYKLVLELGTYEQYQQAKRDHNLYMSQIDWLSYRLCNFSLGTIGNALSIAGDIFGYSHEITTELSRCFNLAVDSNKNGWIITYRTKEMIGSFSKIDVASIRIQQNRFVADQLSEMLNAKAVLGHLSPHFFLVKQKDISRLDFVYHSRSIRGQLFDSIERVKEYEFYGMKAFIFNKKTPFMQDRRLYFKGIARHMYIDYFYPLDSFQTLGIPDKLFDKHYRSVQMITRQFIYDMRKSKPGRYKMLQEYYEQALFVNFSLMDCIVRAIWFYFYVYEHNKEKFVAPQPYNYSSAVSHNELSVRTESSEDSYCSDKDSTENQSDDSEQHELEVFKQDGLTVGLRDGHIVHYSQLYAEAQIEASTIDQILDKMNRTDTIMISTSGLSYVSIMHPTDVVFDARLQSLFQKKDAENRRENYQSLEYRRQFSDCVQAIEKMLYLPVEEEFEGEEEVSEPYVRSLPKTKSKRLYKTQKYLDTDCIKNVLIYECQLIAPKCYFHQGFQLDLWETPEERIEFAIRQNKQLLVTAEYCWHVAGKYLLYAFANITDRSVTISNQWFNNLHFRKELRFY